MFISRPKARNEQTTESLPGDAPGLRCRHCSRKKAQPSQPYPARAAGSPARPRETTRTHLCPGAPTRDSAEA